MSVAFYRPTGGFFEKAHPVTKLICLVLAFVPPFMGNQPLQILPYFVLLLCLSIFSGAAPNLRRVAGLMFILFSMSVVLWTFFQKGQTALTTIGPVVIRKESLYFGITVGIRLCCFMTASVLFLTCTRIEDFTYGLSKLGMPFAAGFALTLAFRLTPLFLESGQTIVMAQKARGLDLDTGGLFSRIRRYVPIIIPILVTGLRRSDQLAIALESKGFGAKKQRTVLAEYPLTWRDGLLLFGITSVTTVMTLNHYMFNII